MKYRFAPLHLPTLYFLGEGLWIFYKDSKLENPDSLELGGIAPLMSIGLALIILVVDYIVQLVVSLTEKNNPKRIIYATEFAIIVFGLLWVWKTFYPTIIRQ